MAALAGQAMGESPRESVALGSDQLTAGVPGEGPLTESQLEAWLADPANHRHLRPQLPLGLAAGARDVTGLADNPLTRAKIELGRQLFFDPRLSSNGAISCASCHDPDHGYAAATQFGVGVDGQEGARNAPAAYNRILSSRQFWDGRAASLEDQAVGPIANAIEMGNSHEACIAALREIPGYSQQFAAIFGAPAKENAARRDNSGDTAGGDRLTIENVGRALASFERVLVTGPSAWDHHEQLAKFERAYAEDLEDEEYLREEDPELLAEYTQLKASAAAMPMSPSAERGAELFFSQRVGCAQCHVGANFADELYHNLGVGMDQPEADIDWGRYAVTGEEEDRGAFKTPTLRNVAQTPPYMHDGSQETLAEVVEWYNKGGRPNPWLSDKIKPLKLTDQEAADLVAFMQSLTGELPPVEQARLPE
ncbi:MAG: cytochrome c peroxidase [Planctomycetota bacterium]